MLIVDRFNAGDLDGVAALYEEDAVMALPGGQQAVGRQQIRAAFERLAADGAVLVHGQPLPTIRQGELALTSTKLATGEVTAEVARRQHDGTWQWAIDQPNVAGAARADATG